MRLRRLTADGLSRFTAWLEDLKRGTSTPDASELIDDSSFTATVSPGVEVEPLTSSTRYQLGIALDRQLARLDTNGAYQDRGMWAWLTYFNRDLILPQVSRGIREKPGQHARYIPSSEWNRQYRHLLRGPWHLVRLHRTDPSCLELILSNPPDTPGEVYEQLASRLDLVGSPGVMTALRDLYFDRAANKAKRGASGKSTGGTARRFGKLLNQLILTYHIPWATGEAIQGLLPRAEFARFAPV